MRSRLGWQGWAWTTGLSVAFAAWLPIQGLDANSYWALPRFFSHAPWLILFGYIYLLAIAWAESARGPPSVAVLRYVGAIAAAGATCIAIAWTCAPFIASPPENIVDGRLRPLPAMADKVLARRFSAAGLAWSGCFYALLATLVHARLRALRLAAAALAEAELGRSEASRKLLASNLDAAQAQVDPAMVIETLEAIEREYDTDRAAAEARLDELAAFLRGAIPHLRSIPDEAVEA
ncbi:MAG TPA: hypothetical protein VFE23_19560 [Usitatibacter sp.]|nr:hypothetical protein [Usitatibacter sp.]